jgi:hypothetical protein
VRPLDTGRNRIGPPDDLMARDNRQLITCCEEFSVSTFRLRVKKRSLFCEKREQRTEIAHVRSFLSIHESNQTICILLLSA